MTAEDVYRQLQRTARSDAAKQKVAPNVQAYMLRHALESFLFRLSRTPHADDFVLKGGLLLGAYGVRRATKDADSNAVAADVTAEHLEVVVKDIAAVSVDDGVTFMLDTLAVQVIRDGADYPGMRVTVGVKIATWKGKVTWDVSTGDPIVPAPQRVTLDRVLGDPIHLVGYAPESTVAEKGVTILERGISSTRWRDFVDIVTLHHAGLDADKLLAAVRAVADYRNVTLTPIGPAVAGYGEVGQAKWAAWRKKERLESVCEENLDDQMVRVAAILDPVFGTATSHSDEVAE